MKAGAWRGIVGTCALLLAAAGSATAAPSMQSDMVVDWTSFTVTPVSDGGGSPPVLSWHDLSSTVDGYRDGAVSVGDWSTPLSATVGAGASSARSDLDATLLHGSAQDADAAGNTSGSIWTLREGQFTVAGSGSVLISVNYSWHAFASPPANANTWDSFASAGASLDAQTHYDPRCGCNRGDSDTVSIQLLAPPTTGSFQGTGTLTLDVPVLAGDTFYFTSTAYAGANLYTSVVPWPPSLWLFACGLCMIRARIRMRPPSGLPA